MFQKSKRLISIILVCMLAFANTDTVLAESAKASARANEGDWAYTISANPQDGVTITRYTGGDTNVVIPGTLGGYPVRTVESDAFPRTVTSIFFPKEVTEIRHLGFSSMKTLERFIVEEGNENYFSRDGVLYQSSQEGKKLFCFPQAKQMAEVTIPEDVMGIGSYAFYKCAGIENVVIGDHVTAIEQRAFSDSSVKNLTLGSGLKSFRADAFQGCSQLETVSISGGMVLQEEWEENPFYACVGLREISISGDGGQYTLRDGVLFGNDGKRLLVYPSMKTGDSYEVPDIVEEIGDGAFYRSRYLKQVKLPVNLKEIGAYAFKGAELLQSVTGAEQLKIIGESAFYSCKKLEVFELPDTLEQVGGEAFYQCTSFACTVVFPSCLKSIGDHVFTYCEKVTEITFLAREFQISENRTSIADHIVIKGYKDSSAENYAKLCGKIFVDIETGERVDYSYTEQKLLELLPENLEYGEPVRWNSVVHEYDTTDEKYVGLKEFTDNLVKDCTTDVEKMTKICDWAKNHITYQYGALAGAAIDSVYHTFYEENPTGNCEVYAQLTAYMLYLENIPCVLTNSYTHQWCDAYSKEDGKWYMVDSTSGFILESGALSSSETYAVRTISFSSNGMVLQISNTSGVELAAFHYGELSSEVTEFTIPDYIVKIQDGVFDYYGIPEDFLLHGKTGAYAEKYVKSNGYECILYQGNAFTACRTHKEKEIKDEETGIRRIICERCEKELETGKFLNRPEITSLTDSDSGVTVVWKSVPLAEKYRVYRKDSKAYEWKLLGETENTTFLDDDPNVVKFGGAYYYTLQAVAEGVESAYPDDTDKSGPYVVCKPGNAVFYRASVEDGGIHLYWAGSDGRRYMGVEIYRSVDGGVSYEKVSSVEDVECNWVDAAADKTKCNTYYLRTYNKEKDTVVYGENSESVTVADLSGASIELSPSAFTYNGEMQTPEVTVKVGDAVLKKGTDYTVAVRDNVNAGTASLSVNGKGFVSGSQTKTYTIEKAAASLTLKADKTEIDTDGRTMVRTSGFWGGVLSFKSSDETVATVTGSGLVTGISPGTATITVTSQDTANYTSGSGSVTITVTQGSCSHNYVYTKTSDATCTSPETGTYTCSKCQDTYTAQNGEALGHDYQETVTAATCTTGGYTDYLCSRCGDSYRGNYISASGHSYGSGTVTKRTTCETDGELTFKCKFCEKSWTLTTPATGHNYDMASEQMIVKPTCQSEGVWEYRCRQCSYAYRETTEKGDHEFYTQFFFPDCTTEGYYVDICRVCGIEQNHVNFDKAYGHDFSGSEPVILEAATCTQPGQAELTCNRCGQTQREVVPTSPHDYQEETIKEVTCTESGEKKYTCSVCNDTKNETVEALGHAYGIEQYEMPTCTETGGVYQTCAHCGDILWKEVMPVREHNFELKETIKPATCVSDGEALYQCKYCKEQQTRTEAATGHEYLPEHVEVTASCWTEGKIISVCLHCGDKRIRTVSKKEHNYKCQIISKPTANQPGRKKYTCSTCGHSYYESYTADGVAADGKKKNTIQASDITKVTKSGKQSFTLKLTQKGDGTLSFKSSNPSVTIDQAGKVTVAKDFVGKVTITVLAGATKEYQAATKQITLTVNPAPVKITKAVSQKQKLVVKWKRNAKAAGYQVQYAMDKKFKSALKTAKIKKNKTISFRSPKLKKGKTYYVRVRTYKNGCYSSWSKRKAVKIRK